jgi:hypothetical protein
MIGKFFLWSILLLIVEGVLLTYHITLPPWLHWLGKLPGDIWIKQEDIILYFPITSAMLPAFIIALIFSMFSRKQK